MKKLSLRETQLALLGLLNEFDRICKEHNLRYSISYGTLIGAVRHKGFVPWDDDVDVCMPRPDYEKFVKLVREEGVLGDRFQLTEDRGSKTYYHFLKLLDLRYKLRTYNHIEARFLYLDIFPVDGMPSDEKENLKVHKQGRRWRNLAGICQWYTMDRWWGVFAYILGWWFYIGVNIFYGRKRAVRNLNNLALKYPFEECEMCGVNSSTRDWKIPREIFENYCEVEFEGRMYSAVSDWDAFLRPVYGDYMQLPSPEKRYSRHYMSIYDSYSNEKFERKKKPCKKTSSV